MSDVPSSIGASEEDQAVQLLRAAGPRRLAAAARAARVREAVHDRWQARSRWRVLRRRALTATALLTAAAALVVIAGRMVGGERSPAPRETGAIVATVERIDGQPRVADTTVPGDRRPMAVNDRVRSGEWVATDGAARVGLRFPDGTSARLDRSSRARLRSASALELTAGAVYVDSERSSGQFEVQTSLATAHDIGTQFEVRLIDSSLRLRVRTGSVELRSGTRSVSGHAGTEVMFTAAGAVSRPIAPFGPEWDWTASLVPPLATEGMALSTFLERTAREHGWTVTFQDPALAAEVSRIVLHGSYEGLPPADALDVAMTTSGLRHRLERGELSVLRPVDMRKR